MKKIVFMLIGMALAFLAENCQDAVMIHNAGKRQRQNFGEESGDI